jgi:peroxiredoxin
MTYANQLAPDARITPRLLRDIHDRPVALPEPGWLTHLQFRRFAGCPVCNLHLQSFRRRITELEAALVREVVVFHSPAALLLPHAAALPFSVIGDPERRLYAEFGVEAGARALLDPRAWGPILRAVGHTVAGLIRQPSSYAPIETRSTRLGLPADFLIDADGRVRACHYGVHVDDQWSVDEVLALATEGGSVNLSESDLGASRP